MFLCFLFSLNFVFKIFLFKLTLFVCIFFYSSLGYVRFKECRNTCLSYYVFEFSRECRDHNIKYSYEYPILGS